MAGFYEKNGALRVDDVALLEIAARFGTPCYVYSASHIRAQYARLKDVMASVLPPDRQPLLCYACKANSNIAILKLLRDLGAGLEIVSEGELHRGVKAGFKGEQIISTSFGKDEREIRACLSAGIRQFNIESLTELEQVNFYASEMGKRANVLFRLNPDIKGGGHDKISTGRKEDKFGHDAAAIFKLYAYAAAMPYIEPVGISMHIGSQVFDVQAFRPAFESIATVVKDLRAQGYKVTRLDIGGGFPIVYKDEKLLDLETYARWVRDIILPLGTEIQMEPGRFFVGNSGVLLTRALYVKETEARKFLVLDAGMNDLIRPALYDSYHAIEPVSGRDKGLQVYDVVGPICESSDIFAKRREIPQIESRDFLVLRSAGAYGFSMASNYNSRPLPAEILVDGDSVALIREPQSLDDLTLGEAVPDWLRG